MLIEEKKEASTMIVTLCEKRLDAVAAVDFKMQMTKIVEAGDREIVINLEQVEFIDSSGLGALVSILKSVRQDGSLAITGLRKKTEQIFKLTRMDTVFSIYGSVSEALEAA